MRTFHNLTSNVQKIYATERAVHEQWTAAEAARELDSRIDRILEKLRWMLAREERAGS